MNLALLLWREANCYVNQISMLIIPFYIFKRMFIRGMSDIGYYYLFFVMLLYNLLQYLYSVLNLCYLIFIDEA